VARIKKKDKETTARKINQSTNFMLIIVMPPITLISKTTLSASIQF
jgi:hypothetical protein